MRVVAGKFKGKALAAPARGDMHIRPTSDRLRESVFNILDHWPGRNLIADARVLDLFAGTGALGLEALSRGAAYAVFVEQGASARGLIRTNIEAMWLTGITKLYRRDATRLGAAGTLGKFSLVFCDPPYGKGLGEQALEAACTGGWLETGAMIIAEEARASGFAAPEGFEEVQRRAMGESEVIFLVFGKARSPAPE